MKLDGCAHRHAYVRQDASWFQKLRKLLGRSASHVILQKYHLFYDRPDGGQYLVGESGISRCGVTFLYHNSQAHDHYKRERVLSG